MLRAYYRVVCVVWCMIVVRFALFIVIRLVFASLMLLKYNCFGILHFIKHQQQETGQRS